MIKFFLKKWGFPIYGQFGAIQKPDSWRIALELTFWLIPTFSRTKTVNRTKEIVNRALTILVWTKVLFLSKMLILWKKMLKSPKINVKRKKEIMNKIADIILVLRGIFSKTAYMCVLTCQISTFKPKSKGF